MAFVQRQLLVVRRHRHVETTASPQMLPQGFQRLFEMLQTMRAYYDAVSVIDRAVRRLAEIEPGESSLCFGYGQFGEIQSGNSAARKGGG